MKFEAKGSAQQFWLVSVNSRNLDEIKVFKNCMTKENNELTFHRQLSGARSV